MFEIKTRLGKRIRLTERQWEHIKDQHPEMVTEEPRIRETLEQPDFVVKSIRDETFHYVRHYASTPVTEKLLLLIAKHLNGDGFIITSFFVNRVRKQGKVVVYGQEAYDKLR